VKISIYELTVTESTYYEIDTTANTFKINNIDTNADANDAGFFLGIMINKWPKKLENPNISDGVSYKITLKDGEIKKTCIFKNKFPKDFSEFSDYIKEVKDNELSRNI